MGKSVKEIILESPMGYRLWSEPFNKPKIAAIDKMLAAVSLNESRILDVGCGPGTNAPYFAGCDYLGVDLNPQYIESARSKFPDLRFSTEDATELSVSNEKFDVVLINSLMHHLDDEGCRALLGSLHSLVSENGFLIVQEPLVPENGQFLKTFFMNQDRGDFFRPLVDWQELFRSSGYEISADDHYEMKLGGVLAGWDMYSAKLVPAEI